MKFGAPIHHPSSLSPQSNPFRGLTTNPEPILTLNMNLFVVLWLVALNDISLCSGGFVVPPDRSKILKSDANSLWISSLAYASTDDYADNPDASGVFVDGFPLPPTPTRPDDDELTKSLRRVPITALDSPIPRRELTAEQPLRVKLQEVVWEVWHWHQH